MGISKASEGASAVIGSWDIILPEILMLISLVGYIVASFPVPKSLVIDNITNIHNYRRAALWWKYGWMLGATFFFFVGWAP
jgi:hypothetical protein